MLPQRTKTQAEELRRRLPEYGWECVEIEQPFEDEWWAAEIWRLESLWSPQGVQVYLTFHVDPMDGENVDSVHTSAEHPYERSSGDYPVMHLGHGWKKELPAFLEALSHFRDR